MTTDIPPMPDSTTLKSCSACGAVPPAPCHCEPIKRGLAEQRGQAFLSPHEEHDTANDMLASCLLQCMRHGRDTSSRDGETKEVLDVTHVLLDTFENVVTIPERKMRPDYMGMELLWYLSGQDKTLVPEFYAKNYRRFAQAPERGDVMSGDEAYCWGAYGARLHGTFHYPHASELADANAMRSGRDTQLELAGAILAEKPLSRQAVVQLWSPKDLVHSRYGGVNDVPCTVSFQFLLRDGRLRMSVNMRSSDVWLGLPNDIFALTTMQKLVAGMLGVEPGPATFTMTSLHVYSRDWEKSEALLAAYDGWGERLNVENDGRMLPFSWNDPVTIASEYFRQLALMIRLLKADRLLVGTVDTIGQQGILADCFRCAAVRVVGQVPFGGDASSRVNDLGLKKLMQQAYPPNSVLDKDLPF